MDTFCEQVVKRQSGMKQKILSALLIMFFALVELMSIMIYFVVPDPFWLIFTLVIAIGAVAILSLVLPRINKVEFDYSVVGNKLYIDKVIANKARKKFLIVEIGTIEDLGKISDNTLQGEKFVRRKECSDGNIENSFYCIYRESGIGRCLLIFSPNQNIIDGMRPAMTRELVKKYFYNK